jgi:hypothetical protein
LWRGTVDAVEPGYDPLFGDTTTFACIDAKADAGRVTMPRTLEPVGYGEVGSTRIKRILDNAWWPVARRSIDTDDVTLGATELGGKAIDELDRTAESASGHVYGDLNGKVRYRRKDWMTYAGGTPADATIGNIGAGDVCPSGWEYWFARDDLTTRVLVGREGETPLVLTADAWGQYGLEPWDRQDLLPLDNFELTRIGNRVLNTRSPALQPRIAAVTLHAETGAAVAPLLASASPFTPSRYRCRHRGGDGRTVFDRPMMQVVGIAHTISPVDGWSARLSLDDATPFENVEFPARWSDPESKWSDAETQWAAAQ